MSVNPEAVGDMPDDAAEHMRDVLNSDEPANEPERLTSGDGRGDAASTSGEGHVGQ
jgi:hypothetical protein